MADDIAARDALCKKHHARDEPTDYLAWHEWAERKAKTHDQLRCPGCGRFKKWVKRG